ncbi:MAG: tetratricopeptide repeat protein, partial [Ekhidna sp.]
MRKFLFLLLVGLIQTIWAQNSIDSKQFSELSAFEEFQARKYQSVISEFNDNSEKSSDEEILLLLSQLKTGNGSTRSIENWLEKNPKHPIKPLAYFHLGEYYFYQKDTSNSKKNLIKVNGQDLTTRDRASYGFVYGVLQLDEANYKNAKNLFQFARKHQFESLARLNYYEAYADYHLGNEEAALNGFEKSKDSYEFGSSSKFFIAKILLEKDQIDEVIALAQSELSDEQSITNSALHQLVGEAYAQKKDEAKADAYFERAIELHPSKPSAALYYQAGVAKFKIGNEDKAIEFLTNAGLQGGEYAQLSAFQLGRLYLKKKELENSLAAYIEASASENDI